MIVKEDLDRRGRETGEITALLQEGLLEGGMTASAIEVVPDEREAVRHLLSVLEAGDLGIILADDVPLVLDVVRGHPSARL